MAKKERIKQFISSRKGQILFNYLYSWGAAVVIIGAMFKIVHIPYGDYILMAGLITEAGVFFFSAFDYLTPRPEADTVSGTGVLMGTNIVGGAAINTDTNQFSGDSKTAASDKNNTAGGNNGASVVIVGGGSGNGNSGVSVAGGYPQPGNVSGNRSGETGKVVSGSVSPGYADSLNNTAQNLEEFSTTIQSLNEASQKLLGAYKHITETHGFVDNLATLNQNVSGLNEVFNSQLQTITEQMSAIRYINDSLTRMKNLYDGAIGDSYMFREESAKMTKHIEALNNVYARLLQAMTTNNNNMNPTNF